MYELSKVTVRFGERVVLDSVTTQLGPGAAAVMGPSGSGKTTLLKVLSGHMRPSKGSVAFDGTPVRHRREMFADPRVAVIYQDYRLVDFLSVMDNVRLASELRGARLRESAAREALERVGLGQVHEKRKPQTLSGGEQQRVAIARALVCGASVLLADEPTGALDADNTAQIADLLVDIARTDRVQVVVATHDLAVANKMDDLWQLRDGQLRLSVADASTADVLAIASES